MAPMREEPKLLTRELHVVQNIEYWCSRYKFGFVAGDDLSKPLRSHALIVAGVEAECTFFFVPPNNEEVVDRVQDVLIAAPTDFIGATNDGHQDLIFLAI